MKHRKQKRKLSIKKNNSSFLRTLLLGLMVMAFCIIIGMVHLNNVVQCFEEVKVAEVEKGVTNACYVISDGVERSQEILRQASALMTTNQETLEEEEIFAVLEQYSGQTDFEHVYFVADDGTVYRDDEDIRTREHWDLEKGRLVDLTDSIVYSRIENTADGTLGMVYYVEPVFLQGEKLGQLIGFHRMWNSLDSSAFEVLKKQGDLFLIDEQGEIYVQDADLYEGEQNNLFAGLERISADETSKENLEQLSGILENGSYEKSAIVDMDGITDYLEVRSVENLNGIYLAYVYPETVYTGITNQITVWTFMTCIMIGSITIVVLFYMWATTKKSDSTIEMLAYGDPVTGGKNDYYFRNIAALAIWENRDTDFLLMRFDIANFRYINEAYGHARADELLSIVVDESERYFTGMEICVRMYSDQFVLLAVNNAAFGMRVEEMQTAVNERARKAGIMYPIRLKRGIYEIDEKDQDLSIMIDRANVARKSLNGDEKVLVATYSDEIIQRMHTVEKIESEMEEAMRNGEFKVYIQPKWDLVHDCIYGGEALVRWIKSDGSMVYPDQFIPVFERNGFIEKLDLYMLEEVCKRMRKLLDEGKKIFPISVNQSRILVHNPDYVEQVNRIIRRYDIPSGYVELEITETVFFDERNLMIRTMNELKQMKLQISMDDFGSGYSSLNMLKDVPFDVMKIDREFFSEAITSDTSILILRKIMEMADGLGIKVICEGVETAEQVEILKELGCCYVQGYYYSKPIDSEEFILKYCA